MRMLWAVSFVGKSKAHENGVVLSCWERRLLTWAVGDAHVKGMIEYSCHWVGRRANHRHCSTLVGPNLSVGPNHELCLISIPDILNQKIAIYFFLV